MKNTHILLAAMAAAWTSALHASPISLSLGGTTDYDGWANLSLGGGYTGVSFPGSGAWKTSGGSWTSYTHDPGTGTVTVGAIGSNTAGSSDALLYKITNGAAGGPYPAGASIYFGGVSAETNLNGGTLGVVDTTPLPEVKTVAFQVEIGQAFGYDFYNHTLPSLIYTTSAGTYTMEASYSDLISQVYNGDIFMPTGYEDIYKNLWGLQFDFSGIAEPILSYEVSFTGVQHAQLYALQMDQSTAAYANIAFPQAEVWLGAGPDNNWSSASNWEGAAVPGTGEKVTFSGGTSAVLDSNRTVDKLTFDAAGGFALHAANGAVLTIGSGGIVAQSATPAAYTVDAPVTLSDFSIITVAEGNALTFAGNLTGPGFYKKGAGSLHLEGDNTFTGNAYNRLIIVGGENFISGTNTYTGTGNLELNVKDGTVTLHGGDNRFGTNFTLDLVSTALYTAGGASLIRESTGRLILGDHAGASNQTFAGIKSDKTSAFYEGASSAISLAASKATITGGSSETSTLTVNTASGVTFEYWGNLGGAGANENNLALVKQGAGVQSLGGTNTYSGATVIEGGMLRIDSATALSANSNVQLNGGVLGLGAGNYEANLGSGAGEIQIIGDGGFAGYGGDVNEAFETNPRTVTLNGGAGLTWGEGGFVGDGNKLLFGHTGATNVAELTNAIHLGSSNRTVQVENSSSDPDGRLSGALSGSGGLVKTGAGNLELTANNAYTGNTAVKEGTLTLGGFEGAVVGDIQLDSGTILKLNNAGYFNGYVGDRIADSATLTMNGAQLNVVNPGTAEGTTYSETIGHVVLAKGANTVVTPRNTLISSTPDAFLLTIGILDREGGSTVNFTAGIGVDVRGMVKLGTAPVLDDGMLGAWITVGSGTTATAHADFASYNSTYGITALTNYTNYTAAATNDSTWTSASNLKFNAGNSTVGFTTTLTGSRAINSVNFVGARGGTIGNVINLNGNTLRVESGGILSSAGAATRSNKITNGTLTAGTGVNTAGELIVSANGNMDISATITNNGTGAVSLTKTGSSILTTTGNNTYSGGTTVNQGTLNINGTNMGGGSLNIRKSAILNVNGSILVSGDLNIDGTVGGSGSISFASGARLGGSGAYNKALTVGSGAGQLSTLSPGNSPGTQSFGASQTWAEGGTYVWELADVDAGAGTGWDAINITGGLDITAGNFTLEIVSLNQLFAAGLVHDFDGLQDYTWTILTTSTGITGFDGSIFDLDLSGFQNSHPGTFSLGQSGNNLNLTYTAAVPEPSTYALLALGGAALWALRRYRRVD